MALSKWLPTTYPLVRTILHGVGLIIMIGWPHLLCKTSMIPPCHLGIKKLHIHRKYPSGSGIYSHTVNHFLAASHRQRSHQSTASTLFTMRSSQGHVNHVTTNMTLLSLTELWNLYCQRTIHFHSEGERRQGHCQWPWLSKTSTCTARCRLLKSEQPTAGCISIFHKYCCYTKHEGIIIRLKSMKPLGVCYWHIKMPWCWCVHHGLEYVIFSFMSKNI